MLLTSQSLGMPVLKSLFSWMRMCVYRFIGYQHNGGSPQVCFRFLMVVFLLFSSYKIVAIFLLPARRIGQRRRATRAPMPVLYSTTGSDIPGSFAFCAVSHKAITAFSADTFFPNVWDDTKIFPALSRYFSVPCRLQCLYL